MRITNLNPDKDIGASAWLLEVDGNRLLMDTGVHPKIEGRASLPLYDLVKNQELDALAISHCHHDHVGSLPVALRYFPQAHVMMTELSYFLVERASLYSAESSVFLAHLFQFVFVSCEFGLS